MEGDCMCVREREKERKQKRKREQRNWMNEDESEGFSTLNMYDIDREKCV